MLRELSHHEVNHVSGALQYEEVYPVIPYGYELIGWSQEIVGYDSWMEYGFFTERETIMPIYSIQPIYAVLPTTTTVYYY